MSPPVLHRRAHAAPIATHMYIVWFFVPLL
jgi:hypothetical protein